MRAAKMIHLGHEQSSCVAVQWGYGLSDGCMLNLRRDYSEFCSGGSRLSADAFEKAHKSKGERTLHRELNLLMYREALLRGLT